MKPPGTPSTGHRNGSCPSSWHESMEARVPWWGTKQGTRGRKSSTCWRLTAVALLSLGLGSCTTPAERATEAWYGAVAANSEQEYRQFIEEFGASDEVSLAQERLNAIARTAEENTWAAATELDDREGYTGYLETSGLGRTPLRRERESASSSGPRLLEWRGRRTPWRDDRPSSSSIRTRQRRTSRGLPWSDTPSRRPSRKLRSRTCSKPGRRSCVASPPASTGPQPDVASKSSARIIQW